MMRHKKRATPMTAPRRSSRQQPKQLDAGIFQAEISSFGLRLAAEGKAAKTIRTYTEAVQWFAAACLMEHDSQTGWEQVDGQDIQQWMAQLLDRYSAAIPRSSRCSPRPASGCPSWPTCDTQTPTCGSGKSPSAARAARTGSSRSATKPPSAWTGTCAPASGTPRPGGPSYGSKQITG